MRGNFLDGLRLMTTFKNAKFGAFDWLVVSFLSVFGFTLRVSPLPPSSLFLDDAWVAYAAQAPISEVAWMGLTAPGFLYLAKFIFLIFGFSEFTALLLPFVFGVGVGGFGYRTLCLVTNRPFAFIGGLALSVAPLNVEYSTHMKQYTFDSFAALVVLYLVVRTQATRSITKQLAAIVLFTFFIGISFQTVFIAVAGSLVLMIYAVRKGEYPRSEVSLLLLGFGLQLVATGLIYVFVIRDTVTSELSQYWESGYASNSRGLFSSLTTVATKFLDSVGSQFPVDYLILTILVLVLLIVSVFSRKDIFLVSSSPIGASLLLSFAGLAPLGEGRTDSYLLVPIVVLSVSGLYRFWIFVESRLARLTRCRGYPQRIVGVLLPAMCSVILLMASSFAPDYPREDLKPLVQIWSEKKESGDATIVYYGAAYAFALYSEVPSVVVPGGTPFWLEFLDEDVILQRSHRSVPSQYLKYAKRAASQSDRIWLLGSHLCACDWGEINRQLRVDLGAHLVEEITLNGASLSLWVLA